MLCCVLFSFFFFFTTRGQFEFLCISCTIPVRQELIAFILWRGEAKRRNRFFFLKPKKTKKKKQGGEGARSLEARGGEEFPFFIFYPEPNLAHHSPTGHCPRSSNIFFFEIERERTRKKKRSCCFCFSLPRGFHEGRGVDNAHTPPPLPYGGPRREGNEGVICFFFFFNEMLLIIVEIFIVSPVASTPVTFWFY